jgi:hypothetical protein
VDDVNFEACVRFGVTFVVVVLNLQLQVNSIIIIGLKNKFFLVIKIYTTIISVVRDGVM